MKKKHRKYNILCRNEFELAFLIVVSSKNRFTFVKQIVKLSPKYEEKEQNFIQRIQTISTKKA